MGHRWRVLSGILILTLGGVVGPGWPAGAMSRPAPDKAPAQSRVPTRVLTLVTGDRVVVSGLSGERVAILPTKARERIAFHQSRHDGRMRVAVHHGSGEGFVSLRVRATDPNGATTRQTITRAYRFVSS